MIKQAKEEYHGKKEIPQKQSMNNKLFGSANNIKSVKQGNGKIGNMLLYGSLLSLIGLVVL